VLGRVERRAGRHGDRAHALALEEQAQLPVDRRDPVGPRIGRVGRRAGLDRPVEVVGERHDLAQQPVGGEAGVPLAFVGGPAAEVLELGALALEPGEVFVRLGVGFLELALQLVDLGEELGRRDVDLVGAFLGSGSVGHG
jgi:hypothetical protein